MFFIPPQQPPQDGVAAAMDGIPPVNGLAPQQPPPGLGHPEPHPTTAMSRLSWQYHGTQFNFPFSSGDSNERSAFGVELPNFFVVRSVEKINVYSQPTHESRVVREISKVSVTVSVFLDIT